jgi:Chromatin modification-related protein EAF7
MLATGPVPAVDVPEPPWTYELEIALLEAIVSYRPVGLHKAMRLVSILNQVNSERSPGEPPLTMNDIRTKMSELYYISAIEEQEDSEDRATEDDKTFTEFQFPYEDVLGIIEDRGKAVEGDCSNPSSPEAVMSVRSGKSGRGTKRRREESIAATNTEAGTEEEGIHIFHDKS